MKKSLTIFLILLMSLSVVFAIDKESIERDKNWEKGTKEGYVIKTNPPNLFSISTLAGSSYDYNFVPGQIVTFRADPSSFNLVCSKAQSVVEIYKDNIFKKALYSSWIGIDGTTYVKHDLDWTIPTTADLGKYEAVNYLVCIDSASQYYQELISNVDTTDFNIALANQETCDDWEGDPHCDGNGDWIKQVYKDCETDTIIIDNCASDEYCSPSKGGCQEKENNNQGDGGSEEENNGLTNKDMIKYGLIAGIILVILIFGFFIVFSFLDN